MTTKPKKGKGRSPHSPALSGSRLASGGARRGRVADQRGRAATEGPAKAATPSKVEPSRPRDPTRVDERKPAGEKKLEARKSGERRAVAERPAKAATRTTKTTSRPQPPARGASLRARPSERTRLSESAPSLASTPRRRSGTNVTEPKKPAADPTPPESERDSKPDDFDDLPVDSTSEDIGLLGIGSRVYPPDLDFELFEEADETEIPPAEDPSVEARIREIEARLAGLMADTDITPAPPTPATPTAIPIHEHEAVDATRELLESDYYRKKWGRGALHRHEGGVDDFGLDPAYEERLRPVLEFLFRRYFRVEVEGIENIPARGRAIVVANHSGALPFDGAMLREAARLHHPVSRDLRWLAEDFSFYLPFIGVTMNRIGAVRACQENAQRLLQTEHVVAVFPEGAEGLKKLYKERYQLQRFGRGGFVRLALKTRSPIVPCAIIGAEETNPILYRFDNLSKLLGLDYLPVTPTFPFLGPLGLLPAPTKWRVLFGEPISVADYGPSAADDHVLVGRLSERVRSAIQGLLDTGLRRRKSIWF